MRKAQSFLSCVVKWTGFCVVQLIFISAAIEAQESIDLKVEFPKGQPCRMVCDYVHSGSVLVEQDDSTGSVMSLPLDVKAKMSYFQRVTNSGQAIRYYENAQAEIKLEKGKTNPTLSQANRLIVARLKPSSGARVEMASINDTLDQTELQLIQNLADPMTLAGVLNKNGIKEGDKWKPSERALAKLLHVHQINESNVQLLLKKADSKLARVYMMGSVNADVDDISTQMEISGIAIVDLKTQMISSFKLGIRETRAPGQIAPGFEGKTKIDLRITPNSSTPHLSNSALARLTQNRKIRQRLKWESQAGRFVVNYDPRWKMITAERDAAVLRFIDKDDILTQCNIVQLPSRPAGNRLSLDTYKKEVAKIVEKDENARFVSGSKVPMPSGYATLRVIVAGEEDGLTVNWFYYHVSAEDGRQVTFVFTLDESVASRVTQLADQMVADIEFLPMPKKVATSKSDTTKKPKPESSRKR